MIFCYQLDRFLIVCLLSEVFTQQNSIFKENIVPKKCNFLPKLLPLIPSASFC